jgi:DNA-binding CsgD family transcriptional regulator
MMLLCVPLMSRKGEFMGLCGLEINSLYFKLAFPMDSASLPPVTGLLVCREGKYLAPASGLNSGAYADNFTESISEPLHTESDGDLNRYFSSEETFVGLERPITLSPLDGDNHWVTALLIPESAYHFSVQLKYVKMALFCLVFLTSVYFLSYRMSRRFIEPILERIGSITTGQAERTEIPEIDDLIEYLNREDPSASTRDIQADMTEYHAFLSNIETLSKAERAVFNLYMKGLSAQEIADHLHLSIHTVKSHNRRIYTKLNVSSRKELLIFINMMNPAERSQCQQD